jgi:hypothetical protein
MNLVQKLPIGFGLACLMILGSCSKEDAAEPQPQKLEGNENSGLRGGLEADPNEPPGGWDVLPFLAATAGQTGLNSYPLNWERKVGSYSNDLQAHPSGLSSFTHLWGGQGQPLQSSLALIPGVANTNSALTFSTATSEIFGLSKRAAITTKIKQLKPGKEYIIKFFVATTIPQQVGATTVIPKYAKAVLVNLINANGLGSNNTYSYDVSSTKNNWVPQSIKIKPGDSEVELSVSALTAGAGQFSYAHIFVDKNSIKEVN